MSGLKRRVKQAVANEHLGEAVLKSCKTSVAKRDAVMRDFEDFETVRNEARAVREDALDHLDELNDRFVDRFTEAGGTVHCAGTAREARSIVTNILQRHRATRGVKSKSMVTEEIELARALEKAGIDAIESDLGEFIVQLAKEPPSHITAPALHRTRQDIGKLFAKHLGMDYSDDPHTLTMAARDNLRQRFLGAEFGICGANFFVAETGHLLIVENEGNARMGLSVPPVLIAVTGLEKAVRSLADCGKLLKVLARSATGQRMTAYVNLFKPNRTAEDRNREVHVVLLDNGRREALADPKLREMMLCIRCGACLNVCPAYRSVGGHAYSSVYPGPMGAILSNLIGEHRSRHDELPNLSTLCGACRDICPVRINIPRMLLELRGRRSKPMTERLIAKGWAWSASSGTRFEMAGRIARTAGRAAPEKVSDGWMKDGWEAFREIKKSD